MIREIDLGTVPGDQKLQARLGNCQVFGVALSVSTSVTAGARIIRMGMENDAGKRLATFYLATVPENVSNLLVTGYSEVGTVSGTVASNGMVQVSLPPIFIVNEVNLIIEAYGGLAADTLGQGMLLTIRLNELI